MRKKRIFALLLAFVLIFSSLPLSAFADEVTTEVATSEEIGTEITEETSEEPENIELDNTNIEGDDEDLGETESPTAEPTEESSEVEPTAEPTVEPTEETSEVEPTAEPTVEPTEETSEVEPTAEPTVEPTATPTTYVDGYTISSDKLGGTYIYPVPTTYNYVSQGYKSGVHTGIDIPTDSGVETVAVADGTVTNVQYWDGESTDGMQSYGNMVELTLTDGVVVRYAHLADIYVSVGESVTLTQAIGTVGSTGNSTGTHLHFEVLVGGANRNPKNYITGEYELDELDNLETMDGSVLVATENGVEEIENPILDTEENEEILTLYDEVSEYANLTAMPSSKSGYVTCDPAPSGRINISPVTMNDTSEIGMSLHYITIDGVDYPAYCLDKSGSLGYANASKVDVPNDNYKAMLFVVSNGYNETGFNLGADSTAKAKFYATQLLVWCAEYGEISLVNGKYTVSSNLNTLINNINSNPSAYVSSDYGDVNVFASYLKTITKNMAVSQGSKPSFTYSTTSGAEKNVQTLSLVNGRYTVTLKDSNSYISDCSLGDKDGLSTVIDKDNNKLTISTGSYFSGTRLVEVKVPSWSGAEFYEFDSWELKNGYQHWGVGNTKTYNTVYVAVKCEVALGSVKLEKSNTDGTIKGFKFTLSVADSENESFVKSITGATKWTKTTNAKGVITFSDLPVTNKSGEKIKYTLTENLTTAQKKVYKSLSAKTVTLTADKTITVDVKNTVKTGKITVRKSENLNWKSGKTFLLTGTYLNNSSLKVGSKVTYYDRDSGKEVTTTGILAKTNESGYATFTDLPYGTYKITEVDGYQSENAMYLPLSFDVVLDDSDPDKTIDTAKTTNLAKSITVSLQKNDSVNGSVNSGDCSFEGAVYQLREVIDDVDSNVETITLDKDGKATFKTVKASDGTATDENGNLLKNNLSAIYYIREIEAPTGYELNNTKYYLTVDGSTCTDLNGENADKVFTWDSDKVEWSNAGEGVQSAVIPTLSISVEDTPKTGNFTIRKLTDTDGNEDYSVAEVGAEFEYYLTSAKSYDNAKDSEKGTLTIGEDGTATTKNLPYGEYTVHQTVATEGKNLADDFTVFVTGEKSENKTENVGSTFIVSTNKTENLENIENMSVDEDGKTILIKNTSKNKPTIGTTLTSDGHKVVMADGTVKLTDTVELTDLTIGAEYTVKGHIILYSSEETVSEEVEKTFTADKADMTIDLDFEVDGSNLDGDSIVAYEYLYRGDVLVTKHEDKDDEGQTVHFPSLHTNASDENGTKTTTYGTTTINDTVTYTNLVVGKEYTVTGTLYNATTGDVLTDDNGKTYTNSITFTAESANGSVIVPFNVDTSVLIGKTIVVFEDMYSEGIKVATHADLADEKQTVYVPEVHTTATVDGSHKVTNISDTVKLTDTVEYTNLEVGQTYTVTGVLMDKSTGAEYKVNGDSVTASTTFTATSANGSVDVVFEFSGSALAVGTTNLVAFEDMTINGVEVATHADITDEGQTVTFEKSPTPTTPTPTPTDYNTPKTGDHSNMSLWFGCFAISLSVLFAFAVGTLVYNRRAKKGNK